jgi:DNA-binding GntR family transcriptional regulator
MKINSSSLHDETVKRIREMILRGALAGGEKIDEKGLSERMGVSRTPIREALRTLSSEGYIDLVPRRGAFVARVSDADIKELFEVMSGLEGLCVRLAMPRLTDKDLEKLEALHAAMEEQYARRDHKAYLKINWEIHGYIQKRSENKLLNEIIDGLRKKITLFRQQQLYQPGRFDLSIQEHRDLMAAIRQRDAVAAEKALAHHLLRQGHSLVTVREEAPSEEAAGKP